MLLFVNENSLKRRVRLSLNALINNESVDYGYPDAAYRVTQVILEVHEASPHSQSAPALWYFYLDAS